MKEHELTQLSQDYLSQKRLAPSTLKNYKIAFKQYIAYLIEHDITYAKTSDVIAYREHKRDVGYSPYTIYIHISALKGLYRYLRINYRQLEISDVYQYSIMKNIKNERIKHHINKPILTLEQARHLILCTKKLRQSIWHYRDHAIIYLMITSGLKRVEIRQAKRADYQVVDQRRILYVRNNKTSSTHQRVRIAPGVEKAIDDYLSKRTDDNPYLFITTKNASPRGCLSRTFFRYMFRRVLKQCGLDEQGITPNCLRHTSAIMNLLRGGTLEATQSLLRHKDIKSTLVYKHYLEGLNSQTTVEIEQFILKEEPIDVYEAIIDYLRT